MTVHDRDPVTRTVLAVFAVLGLLVLLPVSMMTFAMSAMGTTGGMGMMSGRGTMSGMGMMGGMGGPAGGFSPVFGLGAMVVWLVVLAGVGYVVYSRVVGKTDDEQGESALAELREAYVRGDLTEEEFERRVEKLLVTE